MNNKHSRLPSLGRSINLVTGLVWLGVLGFLAKWYHAYQSGNLDAGERTAWSNLVILFAIAFIVAITGIGVAVRGAARPGKLCWQALAGMVALAFLWAVSGG